MSFYHGNQTQIVCINPRGNTYHMSICCDYFLSNLSCQEGNRPCSKHSSKEIVVSMWTCRRKRHRRESGNGRTLPSALSPCFAKVMQSIIKVMYATKIYVRTFIHIASFIPLVNPLLSVSQTASNIETCKHGQIDIAAKTASHLTLKYIIKIYMEATFYTGNLNYHLCKNMTQYTIIVGQILSKPPKF